MQFAAVLGLALAAVLASTAADDSHFNTELRTALSDVCFPVLRGTLPASDRSAFEALVVSKGLTAGISETQFQRFPPDSPTLSRALLVSGGGSERQFVLAIGGVEPNCRLFVMGKANAQALADAYADDHDWREIKPPAEATPKRIAFVRGKTDKLDGLVMIFPETSLPGISFNVIAYAR